MHFSFSSPDGTIQGAFGLLCRDESAGSYDSRGWETHHVFRGKTATVIVSSQEAHSIHFCRTLAIHLASGGFDHRIKELDLKR